MVSAQPTTDPRRLVPWIVYLVFLAVLNETVFGVSIPTIARRFSLSSSGVSWMMTVFMIFFGTGAVIYGKLADIYSLRRLITIGAVLYAAGSVLGFALRFSYPLVVAARAVQGMGASAIPALSSVLVVRSFPAGERGRVFGLITSTISLAMGVGPVIGGLVASQLDWSYLFIVPLFVLVALPFLARLLAAEPRREGGVDAAGAATVVLMIGALVVYLNFSRWYWLAAFAALLLLLALRTRFAANPFIARSLIANRRFRTGLVVRFCLMFVFLGVLFLVPLMLDDVHRLGSAGIGLVLFPGAISSVIVGPVAGRIADRRGNPFAVSIGLALLGAGLVVMALLQAVSLFVVAAALLLAYVGFSFFLTALLNGVSQTLPSGETGMGMGLFNLVGFVSGAIGTAVVGRLLAGGWMERLPVPVGIMSAGRSYSYLMLAFVAIVVASGALYLRAFRGPAAAAVTQPESNARAPEAAAACAEAGAVQEPGSPLGALPEGSLRPC